MISKELLSEVLGKKVLYTELKYDITIDITLEVNTYERYISYNIHELAHKCKEWAHSRGYTIFSAYKYHCYLYSVDDILQHPDKFRVPNDFAIGTSSEPEAIFAACQWVLENKED